MMDMICGGWKHGESGYVLPVYENQKVDWVGYEADSDIDDNKLTAMEISHPIKHNIVLPKLETDSLDPIFRKLFPELKPRDLR